MKTITKRILLLGVFCIYTIGIFLFGWLSNQAIESGPIAPVSTAQRSFTGQDVFDAVNKHRRDIGIQSLAIDQAACKFIVQRFFDIQKGLETNDVHPGFDAFAFKLAKESPYVHVGEIYTFASSVDGTIQNWINSPPHRVTMERSKYNAGCAYSSDSASIVILLELP